MARPVVAFALGGPKELVESSGAGLLASPYDLEELSEKAKNLALDRKKSFELGLKGKAYIENELTFARYAEKLKKVLEDLE